MPKIYYLPDECLVQSDEGDSILDTSLEADIPHTHICGGNARCSTCRVFVLEGLEHCTPRTYEETLLAKQLGWDDSIRLACQTRISGEARVLLRRLAYDAHDLDLMDDQLNRRGMPAAGQEKQIAILFADIRGFTPFAEALPPYDVIYILNRYFHVMGRAIAHHGGMINNYMGDGFMAIFGWDNTPHTSGTHATEQAVRAGLAMIDEMQGFNAYLEAMYHRHLKIGIGIHYGEAVIGVVGASSQNQQVTAIGDAVNLASRLEAANKQVGTTLLISEAAYHPINDLAVVSRYEDVALPGKSGFYTVYEVIEMAPPQSPVAVPRRSVRGWVRGFSLFGQSVWASVQALGRRGWQWIITLFAGALP